MPWPPPQLADSKDCSRSREAVREKVHLRRSSRVFVDLAASDELSARGVMAPEWQASVMSTFHLLLILAPMSLPRSSMG